MLADITDEVIASASPEDLMEVHAALEAWRDRLSVDIERLRGLLVRGPVGRRVIAHSHGMCRRRAA